MVIVIFFFLYLFFPSPVLADDTCCVGHGGDYACNYSTQQLYCQDGTVSNQCTCQQEPTLTPTPTPVPTEIPISQTPECPTNATFDTANSACTCTSGYVVSNSACVTYAQYCQTQYGNNSYYDSSSDSCSCSSGYSWNADGSACVTMDALCNEKLGSNSYYNGSNNSCYCYEGYSIQNGQCQVMPTPVPPDTIAPTTGVPIVPNTPAPVPTIAKVIKPSAIPTKAPVRKLVKFDLNKKVPGLNGFIEVKKKHNGFLADFFSSLWDILKKAFDI